MHCEKEGSRRLQAIFLNLPFVQKKKRHANDSIHVYSEESPHCSVCVWGGALQPYFHVSHKPLKVGDPRVQRIACTASLK